jgi:hypothetical protein
MEEIVKKWLFHLAPPIFCPSGSKRVSCQNTTYQPHSNECGPRTMLALTVMMSHPQPHCQMLMRYIYPDLAVQSRVWMGMCIITGTAPVLPTHLESTLPHKHRLLPAGDISVISSGVSCLSRHLNSIAQLNNKSSLHQPRNHTERKVNPSKQLIERKMSHDLQQHPQQIWSTNKDKPHKETLRSEKI